MLGAPGVVNVSSRTSGREAVAPSDRDRVLDAVKALALLIVVVAHCLAWLDWDTGREPPAVAVLEVRPDVWWVTWLQVLPLFFAVGAVSNLSSWQRRPQAASFWQRRMLRLGTPALVYAATGAALVLPAALLVDAAEPVGRLLAYHLWFLGVYGLVVLAVPLTSRWAARPWPTLALWFALVVAVDAVRVAGPAAVAAVNFVLVWGWVHQVGYALPRLRSAPRWQLVAGGAAALLAAGVLAGLGPYSRSLVSFAGDPELSNLAPPTAVLALFGLGEVLLLAALWPWLQRLLAHERLWRVVGGFAARAVGIYLWHFPVLVVLVAVVLGLGRGLAAAPFGPGWWLLHLGVLALVLAASWQVAGVTGLADLRLQGWLAHRPRRSVPLLLAALGVPVGTLMVALTGFGTWAGPGLLGLPSSSLPAVALLALAWWAVGVARTGAGGDADADRVGPQAGGSGVRADETAAGSPVGVDGAEPPGRHPPVGEQGEGGGHLGLG